MGGTSQGAYHVGHTITLVEGAELGGGGAYGLHDQGDGALLYVAAGYRQRHAFALLVHAHNHEMAGLAGFGNQRSLDVETEDFFAELNFLNNLVHE